MPTGRLIRGTGALAVNGSHYPLDADGRDELAASLSALGLTPTQSKSRFNRDKIDRMAAEMLADTFDWVAASRSPVIVGPAGEVVGGHHRVVAAHLAGVDLGSMPGVQVRTVGQNFRPVHNWIDVLPDVV